MSADDSREPAHRRFEVADHLNHPAVVRAFLWNAVATGNPDIIRRAEASITRATKRREQAAT
jgi:DNA-binding phage protein